MLLWTAAVVTYAADMTNTMTVRGTSRKYIVHVPPVYDGIKAYPVLFMFHGLNSTAEQAESTYYDWKISADTNRFIAVFPDSVTPPGKNIESPPGNIIFTNYDGTGKRWDVAHVFSNRVDTQDVEFIGDILDWLEANYNIRTSHVFTTGHSYGAFFSYYISVCLSNRISAFGEHSGGLMQYETAPGGPVIWWPIDVPTNQPVIEGFLIHSTDDGVVGYSNSVLLNAYMTAHNHPREFVTLTGMAHAWDKTKNQDQWDFFLDHSPVIDDDLDGMPDPWEYAAGLDDTVDDAAQDRDGDGLANGDEYRAGTHPTDDTSCLRIEQAGPAGGAYALRWTGVEGRSYCVERSPDLSGGFTVVASNRMYQSPLNVYTDYPPENAVLYYRIGVE